MFIILGEDIDPNLEGFIDDAVVEEEPDGSGDEDGKRKHEDSELEEDLEEDDYDLIKDNLGIDLKKDVSNVCRGVFFLLFDLVFYLLNILSLAWHGSALIISFTYHVKQSARFRFLSAPKNDLPKKNSYQENRSHYV